MEVARAVEVLSPTAGAGEQEQSHSRACRQEASRVIRAQEDLQVQNCSGELPEQLGMLEKEYCPSWDSPC